MNENTSRMCQASNILHYSPRKDFVQGLTRIKKNGKLRRISIIAVEESFLRTHLGTKTWFTRSEGTQETPRVLQLRRGLHHRLTNGNKREQSSSSMSGMSPHSSGTVGRCSERAGLIISCQKQGRTDQTLLIWLTWWCGLYSSLQDRSWWRSAIESVLISRSSFSTSVLAFAMTSSVRCNTGNRIWCDCEDIP